MHAYSFMPFSLPSNNNEEDMNWDEKDRERETDRQIERERRKRESCHKRVIERQNEMSVVIVNDMLSSQPLLSDSNILIWESIQHQNSTRVGIKALFKISQCAGGGISLKHARVIFQKSKGKIHFTLPFHKKQYIIYLFLYEEKN